MGLKETTKYLLIDGNNLAVRNAFMHENLTTSDKKPSGVHFGFINSIIGLKERFQNYQILIAWDGSSKRRSKESEEGVKKGIIPETYKANRKKDEIPKPLADFYSQKDYLKRGIGTTGIPQIHLPEYEADDIIASYCNLLKGEDIVIVTSDKDYYQLLSDNVTIWDGMKKTMINRDYFKNEYGIEPNQWVDVGALTGDEGDNIFGVPGWGEKTAIKEIKKYGSYINIIKSYEQELKNTRDSNEDLNKNDTEENRKIFKMLSELKNDPSKSTSKYKYPEINWNMPYTGVLKEIECGKLKIQKTILSCLMFQERIKLAYSLKKMDIVDNLPDIKNQERDINKLLEYINIYELEKIKPLINVFYK